MVRTVRLFETSSRRFGQAVCPVKLETPNERKHIEFVVLRDSVGLGRHAMGANP
jgi:hypothetical protein